MLIYLHHFAPVASAPAYLPTVRGQCTNPIESYWNDHNQKTTLPVPHGQWDRSSGQSGMGMALQSLMFFSSNIQHQRGRVRQGKTVTTSSEINIVNQEYSRPVPSILSQTCLKELSPHRMFPHIPRRRVQSILLTEVLEFRHLCSQIAWYDSDIVWPTHIYSWRETMRTCPNKDGSVKSSLKIWRLFKGKFMNILESFGL